jgi:hypothetical protein
LARALPRTKQAHKYRDELQPYVPGKRVEILMIGSDRDPGVFIIY